MIIYQDTTIINIYAAKIIVPKYVKETLTEMKEEIDLQHY